MIDRLAGYLDVILTSADISGALGQIFNHNITVFDIITPDPYTIQFSVCKKDLGALERILRRRGESIRIIQNNEKYVYGIKDWKRPILMILIVALLALTLWLPSRVLFFRTEGNCNVPDQMIIEQAKRAGLHFFSSRRGVRNETIKNSILESNPQLQWVGINTYGCTAIISVRERGEAIPQAETYPISHLIANCDSVIREIIVEQGSVQCEVGQAVKKGQLLVSGYTDCGLYLKGTNATGEIYGDTIRKLSVVFPQNFQIRTRQQHVQKNYSIIIGKKRINLSKGSGISGGTCAKIYEEKYWTLPGGFVLPVGLAIEQTFAYQTVPENKVTDTRSMTTFLDKQMIHQLQSGKIGSSDYTIVDNEEYCVFSGVFYCYEMIGISQIEERVPLHE